MPTPLFKDRVKSLLAACGKTQAQLAKFLKVSPSHLSRVLAGDRPLEHAALVAMADFLGSSPEDVASGTEVEPLARPAGAVVERSAYEDLLRQLQDATGRAAVLEAELSAERERHSAAERDLADLRDRFDAAEEAAQEASNRAAQADERAMRAEGEVGQLGSSLDAANATIDRRDEELRRVRGELAASKKMCGRYAAEAEGMRREISGLRREAGRLKEHLNAANRAVAQNYDAYAQAEQGRRALAQRLQAQQGNVAAAAVFTGLIGLGAGLLGGSSGSGRKR